ncbi:MULTISPECIES: 50S ribosomal protein L32 [Rufibacter]|uniref:Large ribosomal subunit protein bL32 n=5 Tax=Rufibacter TaxID=1379908 RepID=A0A0P0CUE9_9BACT|nr:MULTISPECIES: 50S ribosomal protein L32 [Rufibacter]ALJ00260.1 50S ribosomal protein L32 [Rufibacter tibetensis]KAA3438626.1 50S ribosomal protein L32 [Rufibacter hautae]KAA6434663.1 50S ribosomal protein L32 [Rufibacter glacialis]MBC3538193.1 50S ribosomal protein L32 [Rufibacter sediminis]RNI22530.1 50S ribosomal protein L32 [Rufibacter latericius]
MAHPKRKISKTRRDKRRTHDKITPKAISICPNTGEVHQYHRAYVVDGDLYHNGKVAIKNYTSVA